MSLAELITQYGYLAIFLGAVLEGETVLILAGYAAHQGYLSLPLAMAAGMAGGTLGDQIFFYLGRRQGTGLLGRHPSWKERLERVQALTLRWHAAVIVLVRFLYGLRIAGPMAIGASGLSPWSFVVWNALGAALWAVLVCGAGYLFGHAVDVFLEDAKRYEAAALGVLIALCAGLVLWNKLRERSLGRRARDGAAPTHEQDGQNATSERDSGQ